MSNMRYSSKDILLVELLGECARLLNDAHYQLGEPKFQEIAEFADFAHQQLIEELSQAEK